MSHETTTATTLEQPKVVNWMGGISPYNISYGKLMMWFFLVSDAFSFSGLLISLGFARFSHDNWPVVSTVFTDIPFVHNANLPLLYVGLMTFILIVSSVTMALAVEAGRRMDKKETAFFMFLTILGGFFFLGSQAWEWAHFIHGREIDGVQHYATLSSNPYGPPLFATFFFVITGFHGFHVFSGVVINIIIFIQISTGVLERRGHYEMVEKVGLYWHFVDLVWVFVFTFYYLL